MTNQQYANISIADNAQKKKQLMPNGNRYKTELCKNWQNKQCEYGDKCIFAHGYQEMRPKMYPNFRTQLCKNYSSSRWCPYGSRCQFIHEEEPIEVQVTSGPVIKSGKQGSRRGSFRSYREAISDPTNYGDMETQEGDVETFGSFLPLCPKSDGQRVRPRLSAFEHFTGRSLSDTEDDDSDSTFDKAEKLVLTKMRSNSAA